MRWLIRWFAAGAVNRHHRQVTPLDQIKEVLAAADALPGPSPTLVVSREVMAELEELIGRQAIGLASTLWSVPVIASDHIEGLAVFDWASIDVAMGRAAWHLPPAAHDGPDFQRFLSAGVTRPDV